MGLGLDQAQRLITGRQQAGTTTTTWAERGVNRNNNNNWHQLATIWSVCSSALWHILNFKLSAGKLKHI